MGRRRAAWHLVPFLAFLLLLLVPALRAETPVVPTAAVPSSLSAAPTPAPLDPVARAREQAMRRELVERGLQYLVGIQKDGALGESRQKAVTALFLLACLSSGHHLDDAVYGTAMRAAADWLLHNSPQSFLGGPDEPNEDHALAALACMELAGTDRDPARNLALYQKARAALTYSLQAQDKSGESAYGGGWQPDDRTKRNDRVLSAWFLLELRGAQLRDETVPASSLNRATEFIGASQKTGSEVKPEELGGYSVDAAGLAVRSVTGAGTFASALYGGPRTADALRLGKSWLQAHPPQWQGPHFYPTQFFATRALYRTRSSPQDPTFAPYFARLVRLLRERQDADGSFPLPPGHGQPVLAMGRGYSTALAILLLNTDRGYLPLDE